MRTEPSRTWSLIVTIFGDLVVPRGGRLWLGTLLEICDALEIGGNVVRTAASRLVTDGWLERHRVGRNSYYGLADKGRAIFTAAAKRIYGDERPGWDGVFSLVILTADRDAARTTLEQAGYAVLGPGLLVGLREAAVLPPDAIHLTAGVDGPGGRRLAAQAWPTERLAQRYLRFLEALAPLRAHAAAGHQLSDLDAVIGRLLLVHEYRRLVLRDPLLPTALLPGDWPGFKARALCAELYPALLAPSERWLDEHGLNESGPLPAAEPMLRERFRP